MSYIISFDQNQYSSPANGDKALIVVKITDASGNPLQSGIINLQSSLGEVNYYADDISETTELDSASNTDGESRYYLASNEAGTAELIARVTIEGIEYVAKSSLVYYESVWDSVTSISSLSLVLNDATSSTSIYGNGKHQAGVIVYCEALDANRQYVTVSEEELLQHISLIDYTTGTELSTESENNWFYSLEENEFHTLSTFSRASGTSASLFVMCAPETSTRTKSIAVKAELTSSSAATTIYSTALHGTSGFNSYIYLTAIEAIDYSNIENIKLTSSDYVTVADNLTWGVTNAANGNALTTHTGSKIRKKYIKLRPALVNGFLKQSFEYSAVTNNDVMSDSKVYFNGGYYDGFTVLQSSHVASVIGKGASYDNYYTNIWIPAQRNYDDSKIVLSGNQFLNKVKFLNTYRIKFSPDYTEESGLFVDDGSVTFFNYSLVIADDSYSQYGWSDFIQQVKVSVVDIYGNSGDFSVTWDDGDYFDTLNVF